MDTAHNTAGCMAPKRKSTSKAEAVPAEAPAAKRKSTGKAAAKEAAAAAEPAAAKPAAAKKAKAEAAAAPAEAKPAAAKKAKAGALALGDLVPDVELLREDDTPVKLRASGWALHPGHPNRLVWNGRRLFFQVLRC